jgi:hypothetical protein
MARNLMGAGDANLFYAESVSLVQLSHGQVGVERFSYLLRKIKEGWRSTTPLAYAFYDIRSESDLADFWEESLKKKLKGVPQTIL